MQRYLIILYFVATTTFAGCAATNRIAEEWFNPENNPEQNGKSKGEEAAEVASGFLPQPWGDLVLSTVLLGQNGFLGAKKLKERKKKKDEATA